MNTAYANLLTVDPNESRIQILTDTMQKQGWYSVTACLNSKTAQFLIASKAYDAILIDVNIASEDDFQFLKRIRVNPRYNQIPVIVLVETEEYPLVTTCLEHGATDYIRMPTNETLLKTRLSTHLQQREIRAQALSCLDAFNAMKKLADDLREVILPHTDFEIEHRWSGIMGVGQTKRPIVKQLSENLICGVRLGGMGIAIGSLVGKELADLS